MIMYLMEFDIGFSTDGVQYEYCFSLLMHDLDIVTSLSTVGDYA